MAQNKTNPLNPLMGNWLQFGKRHKQPTEIDKFLDYTKNEDIDSPTSAYALLLSLLQKGGDSNNLLAAFLHNLSDNSNLGSERQDMLIQYFLQMLASQNQREFDLQQLADSRSYNNPLNELARLTGAGIGRDAAIQILQGSAGGSSVIGSGSGASAPSVPAPTGTMDLQRANFLTSAVLSGVQMLGQLIDNGVGIAQGIEQVNLLQSQNALTNEQLQSYNSMKLVTQALQQLQQNGDIEQADIDACSNADDLIKLINSSTNNSVQQLAQSQQFNDVAFSPFGREQLNRYWKSRRESRDAGTLADEFVSQQRLASIRGRLENDKITSEMANIDADTMFKNVSIKEAFARICLTDAQTTFVGSQIDYQNELTELVRLQQNEQEFTNENLRMQYELNESGFPMLKQMYVDELTDRFEAWSLLQNPSDRDARIHRFLREEVNKNQVEYLKTLYNIAAGDFAEQHPGLYKLCVGFKSLGIFDKVSSAVATAASVAVPELKGLKVIP